VASEPADPGSDFVDLTIARLSLSGERREVAEATAWLDAEDRRLLSLWWLETAGELTRAELAAALRLSQPHAAVRVQRMKAQLSAARGVVRALSRTQRCPQLAETLEPWDGRPSALWRKRIARHARHCEHCGTVSSRLVPAEALLAGIGMVPPPATVGAHFTITLAAPAAAPATAASAMGAAGHAAGWLTRTFKLAVAKPATAITVGAVAITGAAVVYTVYPAPGPQPHVVLPTPLPSSSHATLTPSSSALPATPSSLPPPAEQPLAYGSTVDEVDAAPSMLQKPRALPVRAAGASISATGTYTPTTGNPNKYVMNHNGDYLTLRGQGYFRIRWQIIYTTGRVGVVAMPTWTGLTGELFHVASGGSRRMDDVTSGSGPTAQTGMGSPSTGFDTLPTGAQQMWQNEYFYLDGTVVLHQNQGWPSVGLIVEPRTWQQITDDVDTTPTATNGVLRYGLVRDTGGDGAPVPQYLTRDTPTDPATVPQRSAVS
jgi:hypothetical protein